MKCSDEHKSTSISWLKHFPVFQHPTLYGYNHSIWKYVSGNANDKFIVDWDLLKSKQFTIIIIIIMHKHYRVFVVIQQVKISMFHPLLEVFNFVHLTKGLESFVKKNALQRVKLNNLKKIAIRISLNDLKKNSCINKLD